MRTVNRVRGFGADVPVTDGGGYAASEDTLRYGTAGFKPMTVLGIGVGAAIVFGALGYWLGSR